MDIISVVFHYTLCLALFLTKCQPKLKYGHLLFQQSNLLEKYNLRSFYSFSLVRLHLSSYRLYVSEGHDETSTPLMRWRYNGAACEVQQSVHSSI